jgi:hypothetical protein
MSNGFCPIQVLFYGSMGSVSISHVPPYSFDETDGVLFSQRVQAKPFFGTVNLKAIHFCIRKN